MEKISVIIPIWKYTKSKILQIKPFELSQHGHDLESVLTEKKSSFHSNQITQKTEYIFMKPYKRKNIF